jgi:hypothetical protein
LSSSTPTITTNGSTTGRPVSAREYARRRRLTEDAVEERGLDALLTTTLGNICWLTGFETIGSYGFALYATLVQPGRDVVLVSSDFESHNAQLDSWVEDVRAYPVMTDPIDALVALLSERGLKRGRIGSETGYGALTVAQAADLRHRVPDVDWVDASGTVDDTHFVAGDRAASEWTLAGTALDGTRHDLHGFDLWTLRDGLVAKKDSYWKIRTET